MEGVRTTSESMVERVRELGPFASVEDARGALFTTLEVLGECLSGDDACALAAELPEPFASQVSASGGRCEPRQIYQRVAHRRRLRMGVAVEQAQIVGQVLAESLSRSTRARLQQHAPELGELFASAPTNTAPPAAARHPGQSPRADEEPTGRPEIVAHEHSVARSDDPHGDTKLSSSRGLTQEREGRSLATARPPRP